MVKLRDAMKELVDGSRTEITWYSSEKERYILFAGYMTEKDLTHPEISPELRKTLADVAPQDERYALAFINSGRLEDFTLFEHGRRRSRRISTSPALLEPCPLVMGGRSFTLKQLVGDNDNITLSVE